MAVAKDTGDERRDAQLLLVGLVTAWVIGMVLTVAMGVRRVEWSLENDVVVALQEAGFEVSQRGSRIPDGSVRILKVDVHQRDARLFGRTTDPDDPDQIRAIVGAVPGIRSVDVQNLILEGGHTTASTFELADVVGLVNRAIAGVGDTAFPQGSARLDQPLRAALDEVAVVLKQYPTARLQVQASPDPGFPNLVSAELAEQRARSVVSYLEGAGVRRSRLDIVQLRSPSTALVLAVAPEADLRQTPLVRQVVPAVEGGLVEGIQPGGMGGPDLGDAEYREEEPDGLRRR